jgi:hypothetical protein
VQIRHNILLLLSGDFSGYRRSRPIVWTPHSILGIKALRNNVKEPGTKAASSRSTERSRGEGLLNTAAKSLAASKLKEDERLHQWITVHISEHFQIPSLIFLFELGSALSLFRICSYNFLSLGDNSEMEAKLMFF